MCNQEEDQNLQNEIDELEKKILNLNRRMWYSENEPDDWDQLLEEKRKLETNLDELRNSKDAKIRWYNHGKLED